MQYPRNQRQVEQLCNRFTAEQLSDLLGVSTRTAQRYQRGHSTPSKGAIRLLALTDASRIMPDSWPDNFEFWGDELVTGTREYLKWAQLDNYSWVMQEWYITREHITQLETRLAKLLPLIPDAAAADIAYRQQTLQRHNRSHCYQRQRREWYRKDGC